MNTYSIRVRTVHVHVPKKRKIDDEKIPTVPVLRTTDNKGSPPRAFGLA